MVRGNGPVVVVGAGVSGLTSAVCLAEAGREVLVWTAEYPSATTSAVAGAMWGPSFQEPATKTLEWTARSLADFRKLALDPASGVRMAPVLTAGDVPATTGAKLPPPVGLIPDLRPCTAAELPHGFSAGFHSTMPVVDMPRYLAYLLLRLERAGGTVELRKVGSLAEAAVVAPVVLNCSGLGARELARDSSMTAVFGQHVVLENPGLDTVFMELTAGPELTSCVPHGARVVCGGVSIPGRLNDRPDPDISQRILKRCRRAEARLNDAAVVDVIAGLRPGRPSVRVEVERLGNALCVHNYGHGGSGVSLPWG